MLIRFKARPRLVLGVDLSPGSVKILALSVQAGRACIKDFIHAPLPLKLYEKNGSSIDDLGVASQIKAFSAQLKPREVVLAVPDSLVISKTIQLVTGLDEREIEELVLLEANKYLACSADEINLDFQILGPNSQRIEMQDIFFVASRAEHVAKPVELLKRLGLNATIVELQSHARTRLLRHLLVNEDSILANKLIAILELSPLALELSFFQQGELIFTKEEPLLELSKPLDQANFLAGVLAEFKRSLQFFFSASPHNKVSQLFLAGEFKNLEPLGELIEGETRIPTAVITPFKHMQRAEHFNQEGLESLAPAFVTASGLALR